MMFDIALNESSPLYGRADEILRLNPIPASYMPEALGITPKEAVEEYAVWGGVPRYWELREESTDIDSALRHFCINPHGLLYDEVVHVLRDDMRDLVQATTILTAIYFKIPECEIRSLSEGKTNQTVFMFDPFS